ARAAPSRRPRRRAAGARRGRAGGAGGAGGAGWAWCGERPLATPSRCRSRPRVVQNRARARLRFYRARALRPARSAVIRARMPPAAASELVVLYGDVALVVVDMPAGAIVHRGWANDRVTLMDLARQRAGCWVYPAHRLDRGTSGVLVFGLSPAAAHAVERAFAEERVHKRYLALVRGMAPETITI